MPPDPGHARACKPRLALWRLTYRIEPRRPRCCEIWRPCVRGEVYRVRAPRDAHEQAGSRYGVVVQSDRLPLSTWLLAPTSTSAKDATLRPEVTVRGRMTRVLVEQTAAVDPNRLGERVGHLTFDELRRVDAALRVVLDV